MLCRLSLFLTWWRSIVRPTATVRLENLALRHQVAVYQQSIARPKLQPIDRFFWAWLSRLWAGWEQALAFVQPRTVLAWQKKRVRDYWRDLSQSGKPSRPAGSIRKDLLDHILVLNDRHLRRLLHAYLNDYHRFRTHLSLDMDGPASRPIESPECGQVRAIPELGGLQHHDERLAA